MNDISPHDLLISVGSLRYAARALFVDGNVDLDQRDEPWVCTDSYDAGLVAAANYLLRRADQLEERAYGNRS